jgi:ADP-ribose pyrophosphatase
VAIIPLLKNGETFMVRQFRYPVKKFSLEFPMGGIEDGELKVNAAKRELKEETGVEAKKFTYLGTVNPAHGSLSNSSFCYLATEILKIGPPSWDETENLEIHRIKLENIDELIKKGEITDGPTIFAKHLLDIYFKK